MSPLPGRPQFRPPPAPRGNLNWQQRGLCVQVGSDLFFPDVGDQAHEAKAVCRMCDVRTDCLEWALAQDINPAGVWGGTVERERRKLRRGGVA